MAQPTRRLRSVAALVDPSGGQAILASMAALPDQHASIISLPPHGGGAGTGAELPPEIGDGGLALTRVHEPSPAAPAAPQPERLGAHQVLRYATTEEADAYRRIMRVLYLEHQAFGLRLRPAQVADRLRGRFALAVEPGWLESRLEALDRWGAVERDHDSSLASTAAEWRRNRYTYDVTPAGRLTEELLAQLDALGEEIGRLDTARLPSIRDALAQLASELDAPEPDGTRLRQLLASTRSGAIRSRWPTRSPPRSTTGSGSPSGCTSAPTPAASA